MLGTAYIKQEQINDEGSVSAAPISYRGQFDVRYPTNKKGDSGQCFGRIPGTDLTTKNYDSLTQLKAALEAGDCTVK